MAPKKLLGDAYILGLAFGLFGAHHYYLGRRSFGIVYSLTFGLLGIGYLFDLCRMKWLVEHANRSSNTNEKTKLLLSDCYIYGLVGGLFGAHYFYMGNKKMGVVYLLTLGIFGVGWLTDLVRMKWLLQATELKDTSRKVSTAYIIWFSPLGLMGGHHWYLNNTAIAVLYYCTVGLFGIGWLIDGFRMKVLVHRSNKGQIGKTLDMAYTLLMSPFGLFGGHHFYMENWMMGFVYMFTGGAFGCGWFIDIIRLPSLLQRHKENKFTKFIDDAYIYWFFFGIFGIHQFYLGRLKWGILYLLTLGCLGFGWMADAVRIPALVRAARRLHPPKQKSETTVDAKCCPCINRIPTATGEEHDMDARSYTELNVLKECSVYTALHGGQESTDADLGMTGDEHGQGQSNDPQYTDIADEGLDRGLDYLTPVEVTKRPRPLPRTVFTLPTTRKVVIPPPTLTVVPLASPSTVVTPSTSQTAVTPSTSQTAVDSPSTSQTAVNSPSTSQTAVDSPSTSQTAVNPPPIPFIVKLHKRLKDKIRLGTVSMPSGPEVNMQNEPEVSVTQPPKVKRRMPVVRNPSKSEKIEKLSKQFQ